MTFRDWGRSVKPFATCAASVGFLIAMALTGVAFYETLPTSPGYGTHINDLIFLILCPPSIYALMLEGCRSFFCGLVGWLQIAVLNSALYAVLGVLVGSVRRFVS
jgi:hypothetical protein